MTTTLNLWIFAGGREKEIYKKYSGISREM
jgi:hypothetical protein